MRCGKKHMHKDPRTISTCEKVKRECLMVSIVVVRALAFSVRLLLWFLWKNTIQQRKVSDLQAEGSFLYHGNLDLAQVALTFDDGPDPKYTPQVLTILQQYGVQATFFCLGQQVAAYPDVMKQVYAAGHLVGNHSWSHPKLTLRSRRDIRLQLTRTSDAIQQAIGVHPTFFRPPYGAFHGNVLKEAHRLGMATVFWNTDAKDWEKPGVEVIIDDIFSQTKNGSIVLLHDGGGDRVQTIAALPAIIEGLQQRSFQFVTLQQLSGSLDTASGNFGGAIMHRSRTSIN